MFKMPGDTQQHHTKTQYEGYFFPRIFFFLKNLIVHR